MSENPDRLYELLPAVHRLRDAAGGYRLRGLLRVIGEQVELLEANLLQLYENWFIETAADWAVPYLGALVDYRPVQSGPADDDVTTTRGQERERILIPRSEVGNTIRYRRRKGTLSLLEDLSGAVAGWPARAVEFYRLLSVTQHLDHLQLDRGRTTDVREGRALEDLDGAFAELAHTVDIRGGSSPHRSRIGNIGRVGVFVWRLKSYSVTQAPAYCLEAAGANCFQFNVLGADTQLYNRPRLPAFHPPALLDLPAPIRRRDFQAQDSKPAGASAASTIGDYYGEDKSLQIWLGSPRQAIPVESIIAADLEDWIYRPAQGQVAVDPKLGRIVFPPSTVRRQSVWVSYHYGFSGELGGGEYDRALSEPSGATLYRVGGTESLTRLADALGQWLSDAPKDAVIEITDSGVYVEQIAIALKAGQTLQVRAANRKRPVLRLLDWQTSASDDLTITGEANSWLTLDGLLVTGRGIQIDGNLGGVTLRHSTLVPGWGVDCDCNPNRPTDISLELLGAPDCLRVEHSIIGAIRVNRDEARTDPSSIRISDSVLDATDPEHVALGAPEKRCAYAVLSAVRTTVFGQIQTHAIELGENSIFMGSVLVCRSQQGCLRFSYVPPGSRTPRRYECQPDLVERAVAGRFNQGDLSATERDRVTESERLRVEPEFSSMRYGTAEYCQLAAPCAPEIGQGADDESELGVFHDLYQPQRSANLRARLDEFTPAGMDAEVIYAS